MPLTDISMKLNKKCPVCDSHKTIEVYSFPPAPIMQNSLAESKRMALKTRLSVVVLYGCIECNHVWNAAFEESLTSYSNSYNNSQSASAHFTEYTKRLAERLVSEYGLCEKKVVEVGCGKGQFMQLLRDAGVKRLSGHDPTYETTNTWLDNAVQKNFFRSSTVGTEKPDFICTRHVLEHIQYPTLFVKSIGNCLASGGTMYFEFPRREWIQNNGAWFDFFYEHTNYFSHKSLLVCCERAGFGDVSVSLGLGRQYFQVCARAIHRSKRYSVKPASLKRLNQMIVNEFKKREIWLRTMPKFIIWGAGAKTHTFLNRLQITTDRCPVVIDINENKQGKYITGTGQQVCPPESIAKFFDYTVIVANPAYLSEITEQLHQLNFRGKIIPM